MAARDKATELRQAINIEELVGTTDPPGKGADPSPSREAHLTPKQYITNLQLCYFNSYLQLFSA